MQTMYQIPDVYEVTYTLIRPTPERTRIPRLLQTLKLEKMMEQYTPLVRENLLKRMGEMGTKFTPRDSTTTAVTTQAESSTTAPVGDINQAIIK